MWDSKMTRPKTLIMWALLVALGTGIAVGWAATNTRDVEVRVAARSLVDGQIEFAVEHNGERLLPSSRYLSAKMVAARDDRWLSSTPVTLQISGGADSTPTHSSCDTAMQAGEHRVRGVIGPEWGFPAVLVPSATDGDGDGVVCEADYSRITGVARWTGEGADGDLRWLAGDRGIDGFKSDLWIRGTTDSAVYPKAELIVFCYHDDPQATTSFNVVALTRRSNGLATIDQGQPRARFGRRYDGGQWQRWGLGFRDDGRGLWGDNEEFWEELKRQQWLQVELPHIFGTITATFDLAGAWDTPLQQNLDRCGGS